MARDDWRIRIELGEEQRAWLPRTARPRHELDARRSSRRSSKAERLPVSRDDDIVFVYASSGRRSGAGEGRWSRPSSKRPGSRRATCGSSTGSTTRIAGTTSPMAPMSRRSSSRAATHRGRCESSARHTTRPTISPTRSRRRGTRWRGAGRISSIGTAHARGGGGAGRARARRGRGRWRARLGGHAAEPLRGLRRPGRLDRDEQPFRGIRLGFGYSLTSMPAALAGGPSRSAAAPRCAAPMQEIIRPEDDNPGGGTPVCRRRTCRAMGGRAAPPAGRGPVDALAPGTARRRALDEALAEIGCGPRGAVLRVARALCAHARARAHPQREAAPSRIGHRASPPPGRCARRDAHRAHHREPARSRGGERLRARARRGGREHGERGERRQRPRGGRRRR